MSAGNELDRSDGGRPSPQGMAIGRYAKLLFVKHVDLISPLGSSTSLDLIKRVYEG